MRLPVVRAMLALVACATVLTACSNTSAPLPARPSGVSSAAASPPSGQAQTDAMLQGYLRAERDKEQRPDEVMQRMGLRPGQTIADVGAGSGYFAWHFSKAVGPTGKVLAVDIDPNAIDFMRRRLKMSPPVFPNVRLVTSTFDDVMVKPVSLDWAFLCETHFFIEGDPSSMACLRTIRRALKPGGKVAVIELKDDPARGSVSFERLLDAFLKAGFALDSTHDLYAHEYFVIFK